MSQSLSKPTVWIMATAAGVVVANNYYNQPLLAELAQDFKISERSAGYVSVLTQLGYAFGMLLLLPLGDKIPRRSLINTMLSLAVLALVASATAPGLHWLWIASFAIGFTSIVPQLLTPFAAQLAGPAARGRVVGTVMGGLLGGILLSRAIAGFVGDHFGWRAMYWIAAALMLLLIAVLSARLPKDKPQFEGSYASLMRSLWSLVREHAALRESSAIAALHFGAFSAFWTTLAFHLHNFPGGGYGASVAGAFGVVGLVGATAAPHAGKFADKKGARFVVLWSSAIVLLAYGVLTIAGSTLLGLATGVVLLDLGMQSAHVSNMTQNYALKSNAMSRLNTVYMVSRFFGGALGSALGNYAWSLWRWPGVCAVGLTLSALALIGQLFGRRGNGGS
jgi:predicted MFS family arabinose efflux permease